MDDKTWRAARAADAQSVVDASIFTERMKNVRQLLRFPELRTMFFASYELLPSDLKDKIRQEYAAVFLFEVQQAR